ncbi:unnamed protein product [Symbiodinium sp. CCMP2592]|nr:unnamed protein product [Symbiodinium sp. CCMP2592]
MGMLSNAGGPGLCDLHFRLNRHGAALAYAWAKAEVEELGPGSRQLLGSHFTFDPAQGDVFGALTLGATLVALPRSTVLGALQDALSSHSV